MDDGMKTSISFWTCRSIGYRRAMRDRLAIAKMKKECTEWEEVRRSWFSSMFCVTEATDALAREILGDDRVNSMYAVHNQKMAMKNPYTASGVMG